MEKANLIVRLLLGFILLTMGINKFMQFLPMPEMMEPAKQFMSALSDTGFVLPFVAIVEILTGILLIINKYQTLALIVLFPVILTAFLFHLFLDTTGIGIAAIAILINVYLLYVNRKKLKELLRV